MSRVSCAITCNKDSKRDINSLFIQAQKYLFDLRLTWFGTISQRLKEYEEGYSDIIIISKSGNNAYMFLTDSKKFDQRKEKYNIEKEFTFPDDQQKILTWIIGSS